MTGDAAPNQLQELQVQELQDVRNNIACTKKSEWSCLSDSVELCTVNLKLNNENFTIVGVYRPTDQSIEILKSYMEANI